MGGESLSHRVINLLRLFRGSAHAQQERPLGSDAYPGLGTDILTLQYSLVFASGGLGHVVNAVYIPQFFSQHQAPGGGQLASAIIKSEVKLAIIDISVGFSQVGPRHAFVLILLQVLYLLIKREFKWRVEGIPQQHALPGQHARSKKGAVSKRISAEKPVG